MGGKCRADDEEPVGGVGLACFVVVEGYVWAALTDSQGRREDAEGFFDYGCCINQGVQELGVGGDFSCCLRGVRAEDGVVFRAEFSQTLGVLGQEVVSETEAGGGGVVAGEDEDFEVGDGAVEEGFEVELGVGVGVFGQVGFDGEGEDGLVEGGGGFVGEVLSYGWGEDVTDDAL